MEPGNEAEYVRTIYCSVFQDPFATHLMIENLVPVTTYSFGFFSLNTYTIRETLLDLLLLVDWETVTTRPGGLYTFVHIICLSIHTCTYVLGRVLHMCYTLHIS